MIRDEFKKQQKSNVSSKEMEKIRKMGERQFYSSSLVKLKDLVKAFNFTNTLTLILCSLPLILLVACIIIDASSLGALEWVCFGLLTAIMLWVLIWFLFIKGSVLKKIERYQQKLKEINEKEMLKQKAIREFYNQKKENN